MHLINFENSSFSGCMLLERQTGHHLIGSARSSLSTSSDHSPDAAAEALAAATAYVMGLPITPQSSARSRSSAQLTVLTLRSPPPSESRVISVDSGGSVRSLLAMTTRPSLFSRAQAHGGVAAAISAGCTRPGSVVAAAAAEPDADLAAKMLIWLLRCWFGCYLLYTSMHLWIAFFKWNFS